MPGRTFRTSLAHMPGRCGLSATPDGTFALTTGPDSTLRPHTIRNTPEAWFHSSDSVEPELDDLSVSDLHPKPINAVSISPTGHTFATGCDDGFIRLFSLSQRESTLDAQFVQACARFGAPVRTLAFSPTGSFLAAAGEEPGVVKLIVTAQPGNVTVLRAVGKGMEGIEQVAFDPMGDFVASVGEKGVPVVWDVEKCCMSAVVELGGRKASCVSWVYGGGTVAFGSESGVCVVEREGWVVERVLREEEEEGAVSAIDCSPNGKYLIVGKEDCGVALWDVEKGSVLGAWRGVDVLQRALWHPAANSVMLIDRIGQWGVLDAVVPAHLVGANEHVHPIALPEIEADEEEGVKRSKRASEKKIKKKKKEDAKKAKQDQPGSDQEAENELQNDFVFNASDVEADDEEDVKRGRSDSEDEEASDSDEEVPGELADLENAGFKLPEKSRTSKRSRTMWKAPTVQQSFVPTSTPLQEKERKKKHLLSWNLVGAVVLYEEGTHNIIEIEFADAAKRNIGIKDHFGYTMGCLSGTGVLLASPKQKEHGSLITFRPFSSWSNNSDWTQFLPNEEDVSVIALGSLFAAVATKPNNLIRVFSLTGIQTAVFGVQGTVVTAAANDDRLVVVYAEPHSSALRCEMYDLSSIGEVDKVRYSGPLVLCPGTQLEWIGFATDTKELCTYDSNGWLWVMMDPKAGKRWVPMMQNAAKSAECDWFWVASVTSTSVIGAPCLSNEKYPQAKPRPALRTLHLSAPVVDKVGKSGKPTVTERFMRTKYRLNRALCNKADADELYDSDDDEVAKAEDAVARMEVETDKCLLALMEDACRNEQNMRALDLATRLHTKVSFRYAIELARHFKREALASRVEQVAMRKIEVIEQDEQMRAEFQRSASSPVTPGPNDDELDLDVAPSNSRPVTRTLRRGKGEKKGAIDMGESDDDDDASKGKPDEKSGKFTVADVTDDEEEETGRKDAVEEPKPKTAERKVVDRKADEPKAETKSKKRSIPMQESQASVKGGAKPKTGGHAAKKAKVQSSTSSKRGFHNRFLKK